MPPTTTSGNASPLTSAMLICRPMPASPSILYGVQSTPSFVRVSLNQ